MSMNPLVSFVIPHFNRAAMLIETIESIRAQSYKHWEIIVVDDGSTDQEWEAIQRFATDRIRTVQRTDGIKGPSRCRNLGAATSRGDYLIFVDSDDILAPWCLTQRLKSVYDLPEKDLWIFPVMLFNISPGDMRICWNRLEGDNDLQRFLCSDPPWHTSSPIWRRDVFIRIGGFNEVVFYGDDSDLHIKMLLKGIEYEKCLSCLPDAFIRRGIERRITNSWSQSLLDSRQVRLFEGTRMLRELEASSVHWNLWEGQYFVEGEELLFNIENSTQAISNVVNCWIEHFQPSFFRKLVVQMYFGLGIYFRKRFYLALRLARRVLMATLPNSFFPKGGYFQCWRLGEQEISEIRDRLWVANECAPGNS